MTPQPDSKEATIKQTILCRILAVCGIVALGLLLNFIASHLPLKEISPAYADVAEHQGSRSFWQNFLITVIISPLWEELLCRWLVCGNLAKIIPPPLAVIFSSLLFGIIHANVVQFTYASIMGLALGALYIKTRRLYMPIAAHSATNLATLLVTLL